MFSKQWWPLKGPARALKKSITFYRPFKSSRIGFSASDGYKDRMQLTDQ